ncbi:Hypothetical predicted protein [Cloeon dipterum]|uniref:Uncharacterized protein n=1 Tax=Cloeon dipterum TaxID=197152 RepID=A0A8S1DJB1_9INSE|nr:Hypothetical predicted protein [Cloeon dipterum]
MLIKRTEKRPLDSPLKARTRVSVVHSPSLARYVFSHPAAAAHATKMVVQSLLDITFQTMFENIDNYDKNLVYTCIGPIRPKMLHTMFQMAARHHLNCDGQGNHIDKLWANLPLLFYSKFFTKLDTEELTRIGCRSGTLSNSRFQEFIRCLGSNTPNLKELIILNSNKSLGEREIESIIQLKKLSFLEILNVDVPLSGLLEISRRCEKLKSIKATEVINDEEASSVAFRDDFVFVYIDVCDKDPGKMWVEIETTMPTWSPILALHTSFTELTLVPKQNREFLLAVQFAKNLKKIDFNSFQLEDIEDMVEFVQLPDIKYATINCGGKSAHALRCFVRRNGESLQELSLREIDIKENMTFSEIFSFCPNLEALQLINCIVSGNDAPVDAMHRLKRFEWTNYVDRRGGDSNAEVAFSSILSAPLLEELCIDLPKIDFSDNATVIARIARRDILQNLKTFGMYITMKSSTEDELEISSSYVESFAELKNAIASAI